VRFGLRINVISSVSQKQRQGFVRNLGAFDRRGTHDTVNANRSEPFAHRMPAICSVFQIDRNNRQIQAIGLLYAKARASVEMWDCSMHFPDAIALHGFPIAFFAVLKTALYEGIHKTA
jgi:hypothetical protein